MQAVATRAEAAYDWKVDDRSAKLAEFVVEARRELRAFDARLMQIATRLDATATKADVAELGSTMVKWVVGAVSGLGIAGITVMTSALNNAVPKAPSASPTPIIITVPPAPAAPGATALPLK